MQKFSQQKKIAWKKLTSKLMIPKNMLLFVTCAVPRDKTLVGFFYELDWLTWLRLWVLQWMTEAAFPHLPEAEGQRLKDIWLFGQIPKPKPNVESFLNPSEFYLICRFILNFANPFLIKPCENLDDRTFRIKLWRPNPKAK